MICEIPSWTLFGKDNILELVKLKNILENCPITIKLTTSSHLSYDLARLLEWFNSHEYNYFIDSRKDELSRDIIHFEVGINPNSRIITEEQS